VSPLGALGTPSAFCEPPHAIAHRHILVVKTLAALMTAFRFTLRANESSRGGGAIDVTITV
jgi:hypothetical protein